MASLAVPSNTSSEAFCAAQRARLLASEINSRCEHTTLETRAEIAVSHSASEPATPHSSGLVGCMQASLKALASHSTIEDVLKPAHSRKELAAWPRAFRLISLWLPAPPESGGDMLEVRTGLVPAWSTRLPR